MILDNTRPMTKQHLAEITATAATLHETTDQLNKLCTRRHPDLVQAIYLLRQAQTKLQKTLGFLDRNL